MALILDGTNGETFPSWTTSGRPSSPTAGQMGYNSTTGQFDVYSANGWGSINSTANPQSGSVIQVVNAVNSTPVSTSSTSYVTTGFTASITPKFSTSNILVFVSVKPTTINSTAAVNYQLWRGGSSVFQISSYAAYLNVSGLVEFHGSESSVYLDSPATNSSITYSIYYRSVNSGQTIYNNANNDVSSITLMEIAQ